MADRQDPSTSSQGLLDKICNAGARRYGPEWFVAEIDNSTTTLVGSRLIGGVAHGYAMTSPAAAAALPKRFTAAYYVKAKTGTAAIAVDGASVVRAAIDGVPVAAGLGASPVVLANADGWKHVCLEARPQSLLL